MYFLALENITKTGTGSQDYVLRVADGAGVALALKFSSTDAQVFADTAALLASAAQGKILSTASLGADSLGQVVVWNKLTNAYELVLEKDSAINNRVRVK